MRRPPELKGASTVSSNHANKGEMIMKVSEIMSRDVRVASPRQTIQDAAAIMAEIDAGIVPVGENDHLVGMITDRDIAIRAIAKGKGPETAIEDIMTKDVKYCYEDDESDHVLDNLGDLQIRRVPVINRSKRLVGILSLGDLANQTGNGHAGAALAEISRPGGQHSQTRM
jgi:CBS domain-containing protein